MPTTTLSLGLTALRRAARHRAATAGEETYLLMGLPGEIRWRALYLSPGPRNSRRRARLRRVAHIYWRLRFICARHGEYGPNQDATAGGFGQGLVAAAYSVGES